MPIPIEVPTRPQSTHHRTTRALRSHVPRTAAQSGLVVRPPEPSDGAQMWALARDGGELDLNSSYAYLLMARDFATTCRIAMSDNEIVGYVLGFRPPERPSHLFVWQVAVRGDQRGRGVARRMIGHLLETTESIDALEATVEETNSASRALFGSIARQHDAELTWSEGIPSAHFPDGHAGEPMLRIAPLR
ncbi:diaminobutyrate acetyltransferase [Flexivirga oryzae]|uniref:L-2,4-diaminobutyric acid acetyltransferase n=1 Tax=Flexivirga oryzae TaxID=1794944 RepID=A0A839N0U4_9MICO|nr:diaminobutyrate acetyltransferase [Flexivirga oryzae]MBB2891328.1 L-2,4-diaminobutyric acid acetyltransferase [Flexivirga oryzae]